ncbi:MAG: metal ABC transporter permease [Bacillota bacterium]|nr:metal ABC transporter permease [Bacillota bacterium]
MIDVIQALLEYQFLQHALLAAILASVTCGIVGVIVVEKKLIMMSGGIAHTAYGGVGLGYLLGFEPIIGAFFFAILAALGIGRIRRKGHARTETVISLFWSLGMALGVLFIALMPGYPPALTSYLFGSILAVTRADLILMVCLTVLVLLQVIAFYHHWKTFLFDEQFAAILGMRTVWLENWLLILIAMTVVTLIRIVGIILLLAMLAAPAAIAAMVRASLGKRMLIAILIGLLISLSGLWLSYTLNLASGAVIAILSALSFFSAGFLRSQMHRMIKQKVARPDQPIP